MIYYIRNIDENQWTKWSLLRTVLALHAHPPYTAERLCYILIKTPRKSSFSKSRTFDLALNSVKALAFGMCCEILKCSVPEKRWVTYAHAKAIVSFDQHIGFAVIIYNTALHSCDCQCFQLHCRLARSSVWLSWALLFFRAACKYVASTGLMMGHLCS